MHNKSAATAVAPLLSLCIPTFNRSASVNRLVRSILACDTSDIEIIVSNNASPDDTLDVLNELADARLKIYSSSENQGALFNMLRALSLGTGKYVIYCTDQDYFLANQLTEFLELLRHESQISCGFCLLPVDADRPTRTVPAGYDAMLAVAYRSRHPTGYFFRSEDLKAIGFPDKFSRFDEVELFPLEFVFAELALKGAALIYRKGLFQPEVSKSVTEHKSSTTDGKSKTAFFSPDSRLRMSIKFAKHLDRLTLSRFNAVRIESSVFLSGIWVSTVGYRSIMANEQLCAHYRMGVEKISVFQVIAMAARFTKRYFDRRRNDKSPIILHALVICCFAVSHLISRVAQKIVT
ncbi:glycosyltransferase family A protein [Variovorax sp. PCZ-1]|uniref:glycosyltransferase family 2 protein n=1 Tax=Variovorax sp. PCZ-1 TaxID=2835533 RepID=UPI001BCBA708|nr:glycosyltransferase family A protein [Variovorax sp. PCZ-1]MBS7808573.1 glycosyltransferase family 2 protein [Variovorax sp. PCZ-1]